MNPFLLNISAPACRRMVADMTHEHAQHRHECSERIMRRCEDIIEALEAAQDDPKCTALRQFINGRGDLVIGMQGDVNDLLQEFDLPLSRQPADEARFVAATAKVFG